MNAKTTSLGRRTFLATLAGASTWLLARRAAAGLVPANLQAQLVVKVAAFDRNFAARAGATALILVVHKGGDTDSSKLAASVEKALGELGDVGGKPKKVETIAFPGAAALAAKVKGGKVAIVYFSSGLEGELGGVAGAMQGLDVLTFGASGAHAEKGTVVGFDLEEGKPKLVVNQARAKAQNVAFKAELLKLARLV
jgi:hypothetical protein